LFGIVVEDMLDWFWRLIKLDTEALTHLPPPTTRRPAFALMRKEATLSENQDESKRAWRSGARPKHLMVRLTLDEHAEITRRAGLARKSAAGF
jgi:hypothetical protein